MANVRRIVASAVLAGAVTLPRVLFLPRGFWSGEEVRFAQALIGFEPLHHQPEAPGYPLYVALGRAALFFCPSPFVALVALSIAATFAGAMLFAQATAELVGSEPRSSESGEPPPRQAESWTSALPPTALIGTLFLFFSPALLVYTPLPNPHAVTMAFAAASFLALARRHVVGLALTAAAMIGCLPQLAPAAIVFFILGLASMRRRLLGVAIFAIAAALPFVPLIEEIGRPNIRNYAMTSFAAVRRASEAAGLHGRAVMMRFAVHPWGSKALSAIIVVLLVAGAVSLWRTRRLAVIPVAAFGLVHLIFCILVADRSNGVEPVLPALAAMAMIAAGLFAAPLQSADDVSQRPSMVRSAAPVAGVAIAVLYGAGALAYAWPILRERSTMRSPSESAARLSGRDVAGGGVLLYDSELEPFAQQFAQGASMADAARHDEFALAAVPVWLLADRPSRVAGARVFEWPDSDAYGKLTTERFRVASLVPIPPARRFAAVGGVYAPEHDIDGREWRWLARDATIRLLPLNALSVRIELTLALFAPYESNSVEVLVNGRPAGRVDVTKASSLTTITVPAGTELTFRAARAFVPVGATDERELSVQLVGIEQR